MVRRSETACIITTGANGVSAAIHPRLPALIEPEAFPTRLESDETRTDVALALLMSVENDVLTFVPVADAVNTVGNDGPTVQTALAAPPGSSRPSDRRDEERMSLF